MSNNVSQINTTNLIDQIHNNDYNVDMLHNLDNRLRLIFDRIYNYYNIDDNNTDPTIIINHIDTIHNIINNNNNFINNFINNNNNNNNNNDNLINNNNNNDIIINNNDNIINNNNNNNNNNNYLVYIFNNDPLINNNDDVTTRECPICRLNTYTYQIVDLTEECPICMETVMQFVRYECNHNCMCLVCFNQQRTLLNLPNLTLV